MLQAMQGAWVVGLQSVAAISLCFSFFLTLPYAPAWAFPRAAVLSEKISSSVGFPWATVPLGISIYPSAESSACFRKHLPQHLEHLLWLWFSLCHSSLFLFSLSSSVIFLPFWNTSSQTYCQLCWWSQLWPVVGWAVSGAVQALSSPHSSCIPPATKTLPWTPSMRNYERFYAVLLRIKKT